MSSTIQELPSLDLEILNQREGLTLENYPELITAEDLLDSPVVWDFSGPLSPGSPIRLSSPRNQPSIEIKMARRRKVVRLNDRAWEKRNDLLCVAENSLDRAMAPGYRSLSPCVEGLFKEELSLLDSLLYAQPVVLSHQTLGFRLDPWKYDSLLIELRKIEEKRSPTLKFFSITPPRIPSLLEEWPSDSIWGSSDLEVLAVTLQEDVENYLAFYWDIVAKEKGTYKPSKDNIAASFFPPLTKDPNVGNSSIKDTSRCMKHIQEKHYQIRSLMVQRVNSYLCKQEPIILPLLNRHMLDFNDRSHPIPRLKNPNLILLLVIRR